MVSRFVQRRPGVALAAGCGLVASLLFVPHAGAQPIARPVVGDHPCEVAGEPTTCAVDVGMATLPPGASLHVTPPVGSRLELRGAARLGWGADGGAIFREAPGEERRAEREWRSLTRLPGSPTAVVLVDNPSSTPAEVELRWVAGEMPGLETMRYLDALESGVEIPSPESPLARHLADADWFFRGRYPNGSKAERMEFLRWSYLRWLAQWAPLRSPVFVARRPSTRRLDAGESMELTTPTTSVLSLQITAVAVVESSRRAASSEPARGSEPAVAEVRIYAGDALHRVLRFSHSSPIPRMVRVLTRSDERVRVESVGVRASVRERRFEPRGALGALGHPRRWSTSPAVERVQGPARAAAEALAAPDEARAGERISQALGRSDLASFQRLALWWRALDIGVVPDRDACRPRPAPRGDLAAVHATTLRTLICGGDRAAALSASQEVLLATPDDPRAQRIAARVAAYRMRQVDAEPERASRRLRPALPTGAAASGTPPLCERFGPFGRRWESLPAGSESSREAAAPSTWAFLADPGAPRESIVQVGNTPVTVHGSIGERGLVRVAPGQWSVRVQSAPLLFRGPGDDLIPCASLREERTGALLSTSPISLSFDPTPYPRHAALEIEAEALEAVELRVDVEGGAIYAVSASDAILPLRIPAGATQVRISASEAEVPDGRQSGDEASAFIALALPTPGVEPRGSQEELPGAIEGSTLSLSELGPEQALERLRGIAGDPNATEARADALVAVGEIDWAREEASQVGASLPPRSSDESIRAVGIARLDPLETSADDRSAQIRALGASPDFTVERIETPRSSAEILARSIALLRLGARVEAAETLATLGTPEAYALAAEWVVRHREALNPTQRLRARAWVTAAIAGGAPPRGVRPLLRGTHWTKPRTADLTAGTRVVENGPEEQRRDPRSAVERAYINAPDDALLLRGGEWLDVSLPAGWTGVLRVVGACMRLTSSAPCDLETRVEGRPHAGDFTLAEPREAPVRVAILAPESALAWVRLEGDVDERALSSRSLVYVSTPEQPTRFRVRGPTVFRLDVLPGDAQGSVWMDGDRLSDAVDRIEIPIFDAQDRTIELRAESGRVEAIPSVVHDVQLEPRPPSTDERRSRVPRPPEVLPPLQTPPGHPDGETGRAHKLPGRHALRLGGDPEPRRAGRRRATSPIQRGGPRVARGLGAGPPDDSLPTPRGSADVGSGRRRRGAWPRTSATSSGRRFALRAAARWLALRAPLTGCGVVVRALAAIPEPFADHWRHVSPRRPPPTDTDERRPGRLHALLSRPSHRRAIRRDAPLHSHRGLHHPRLGPRPLGRSLRRRRSDRARRAYRGHPAAAFRSPPSRRIRVQLSIPRRVSPSRRRTPRPPRGVRALPLVPRDRSHRGLRANRLGARPRRRGRIRRHLVVARPRPRRQRPRGPELSSPGRPGRTGRGLRAPHRALAPMGV